MALNFCDGTTQHHESARAKSLVSQVRAFYNAGLFGAPRLSDRHRRGGTGFAVKNLRAAHAARRNEQPDQAFATPPPPSVVLEASWASGQNSWELFNTEKSIDGSPIAAWYKIFGLVVANFPPSRAGAEQRHWTFALSGSDGKSVGAARYTEFNVWWSAMNGRCLLRGSAPL